MKELLGCWQCPFTGLGGGCGGIYLEIIIVLVAHFCFGFPFAYVLYFAN